VGEPVKSLLRRPNTRRGRTRTVALRAGLRKSTSYPVPYLAFIRSTTRCSRAGSFTIRAVPSRTTGSVASSVVTQHCELAARLRILREPMLLLNHSTASSHMPQTGIECGLPSGHTLDTQ
jgi:hypothetical protein